MAAGQLSTTKLLAKGWRIADKPPLDRLHPQSLNSFKLVVLVGPKNRYGADYFQVFLQNPSGEVSDQPVLVGLCRTGRYPAYNWFEIAAISRELTFGKVRETLSDTQVQQLFRRLTDLIPPGGHLMVEYESPEWQETAQTLARGVPPVATPLGYLMFSVGCGVGFKDWYFSEGGAEGPRKLQGFKALNTEHARAKDIEMLQELREFLNRSPSVPALEKEARKRARAVIKALEQQTAVAD